MALCDDIEGEVEGGEGAREGGNVCKIMADLCLLYGRNQYNIVKINIYIYIYIYTHTHTHTYPYKTVWHLKNKTLQLKKNLKP